MDVSDDFRLLRRYVDDGSDAAFAELVSRHADMVYATARRQLGAAGPVDEVTQATFILLMRKADRLPPGTVVAGWLHKTARYAAANARRAETRRRKYERRAADMNAANTPKPAARPDAHPWADVAPHLDEAIARLAPADRSAVVLRFLERRSMAEVGRSLGVSEHAAQMRVSRALEKLRHLFARRGVAMSAAALGVMVLHQSAEAAPATLINRLTPAALRGVRPVANEVLTETMDSGRSAIDNSGRALADRVARRQAWQFAARVAGLAVLSGIALCLMVTGARLAMNRLPNKTIDSVELSTSDTAVEPQSFDAFRHFASRSRP